MNQFLCNKNAHFISHWVENRIVCILSVSLYWIIYTVVGGWDGKESACNAGDPGLIPGLRRSPGKGNGNPLQYFRSGSSMDRGAWWAIVHGIAENQTQLSNYHNHKHTHTGSTLHYCTPTTRQAQRLRVRILWSLILCRIWARPLCWEIELKVTLAKYVVFVNYEHALFPSLALFIMDELYKIMQSPHAIPTSLNASPLGPSTQVVFIHCSVHFFQTHLVLQRYKHSKQAQFIFQISSG